MNANQSEKIKIYDAQKNVEVVVDKVIRTDEQWRQILTPEQFNVTRKKGTERAFTGQYWNHQHKGIYKCIGCGTDLFRSDDKFDSGTGWPSYTRPIAPENVAYSQDNSFFSRRTEVHCPRCGGHLGHVFDDGPAPILGPAPTRRRFCVNSAALEFHEQK